MISMAKNTENSERLLKTLRKYETSKLNTKIRREDRLVLSSERSLGWWPHSDRNKAEHWLVGAQRRWVQWSESARVERRQIQSGRYALGDQLRQGFTRCRSV